MAAAGEEGHLETADLPPEVDRVRVEEARRTYQQRPAKPVLHALAGLAARKTVILGDPGAGKSTLAKYLMLALAAENAAAATGWEIPPDLAGRLPILVELRTFADQRWRGQTFLDLIDELERGEGLGIPKRLLEEFLRAGGRALVVFDGLDEIFEPRVRAEVTMIPERFAAEAITRLLAADPHWRVRRDPPRHILLALRAIGEVRRNSVLAQHSLLITRNLTDLLKFAADEEAQQYDHALIETIESILRQLLDGSASRWLNQDRYLRWYGNFRSQPSSRAPRTARAAARLTLALRFHTRQEAQKALEDSDKCVRWAAVEAVASGWPGDPRTLSWLQERAVSDAYESVRGAAMEAVASGWAHDPQVLGWLQERAVHDRDEGVRGAAQRAAEELADWTE